MTYRLMLQRLCLGLSATLFLGQFASAQGRAGGLSFSSSFGSTDGVSISSTEQDGVRTINGNSTVDGKFEIVIDEDDVIKVTMTRSYGVDDADELMQSHPELYMYLKAIPREIGDSKINIKIEVETTHEADSADELKEKNADAFALYEKYGKEDGIQATLPAIRAFRAGGPGGVRRLEIMPMEGAVAPSIILRVDPNGDIKASEDEQAETSDDDDKEAESIEDESKKEELDSTKTSDKPLPGKPIK